MRTLLMTAPIALCIGLAACGQKTATENTTSATTNTTAAAANTTATATDTAAAPAPAPAPSGNALAENSGRARRGLQPQTLDEMLKRSMNRFARLDLNGDGKLTKEEIEKAPPPRNANPQAAPDGRPRTLAVAGLMRADTNKDGVVSKEEMEAQTRERFKRLDTNGDGTVTPEEIQARAADLRGRRERKAAAQGGGDDE